MNAKEDGVYVLYMNYVIRLNSLASRSSLFMGMGRRVPVRESKGSLEL